MRVAIYIRTSTEDQNPENQLKDIYTMIPEEEGTLVYKDQVSAWKDKVKRPAFENVKLLIKNREVTDLYVWDWDRLFRNRKKLKSFMVFCKLYNCKLHSYRQKFMEDIHNIPEPFNEIVANMMTEMLGWLAEDESNRKSERIKAAVRTKKGKTMSYKGNKWGRKALPKQTIDRVMTLRQENPNWSLRRLASECYYYDKNKNKKFLGVSTVHKVLKENKDGN